MTRARLGALLAGIAIVLTSSAPAASAAGDATQEVFVFRVEPASFEGLLAIPQVQALARRGGAALLVDTGVLSPDASVGGDDVRAMTLPSVPSAAAGAEIERRVRASDAGDVLVIVMSLEATPAMRAVKDELHPVVLARGSPDSLFASEGPMWTLTSDSTRRTGVVIDADLGATVASFRGELSATAGEPIDAVEAPPPYDLHARYVEQRRLSVPMGTAAALAIVVAGILAVVCLVRGERIDRRVVRAAGWASIAVPALAVALLGAGHLTELTYANVIPFVALVTVLGTLAFTPLERLDVTPVPEGIGLAVLGFFVVEAALGWSGMLTPLLGGSQLDGGRFYGLPNVAIGLLIGASVWVAQRWSTWRGFALICAVALFAGLPLLGANLGGAVTLFATAGMWLAVRERGRLGVARGVAVVAGVTIAGTALVLVAHAVSPVATHVTEFERSVNGAGGVAQKIWDRLSVGLRLMARSPASIVPVVGLPVVLAVAWRAPGAIGDAFRRWPAWRDATFVVLLGGVVAFLANDSGPAASGLAFGLGLGGMVGVSLLAQAGKMVDG